MYANTYDNAAQTAFAATMLFPGNTIATRSRTSKNLFMARFPQLHCNFFPVFFRTFISFILLGLASNPFSCNRNSYKLAPRAIQLQDLILYSGPVPGTTRNIE